MARIFWLMAACFGFLGVALGAFGAHALKTRLSVGSMAIFQTGIQYHFVHTLALLATGLLLARAPRAGLVWAGWLFAAGIIVFSGSLYALALTEVRILGAITPLGGVAFLTAWVCLAWAGWVSGGLTPE